MRCQQLLCLSLLALSFASEARFKFVAPPPDTNAKTYFSGQYPDSKTNVASYKVPDSYYGVSKEGSGSILPALLLGPLGGVASAMHASSESKKSADSVLFSTNIPSIFGALGYATAAPSDRVAPHYELTPAALYLFKSDSNFSVYCNLKAAYVAGGRSQWKARYMIQNESSFDKNDANLSSKLNEYLASCYATDVALFELHKKQGDAIFGEQPGLTVNGKKWPFPPVTQLLPSRLVYKDDIGLYQLDPSHWALGVAPGQ